jgi:hypothetical protein
MWSLALLCAYYAARLALLLLEAPAQPTASTQVVLPGRGGGVLQASDGPAEGRGACLLEPSTLVLDLLSHLHSRASLSPFNDSPQRR